MRTWAGSFLRAVDKVFKGLKDFKDVKDIVVIKQGRASR